MLKILVLSNYNHNHRKKLLMLTGEDKDKMLLRLKKIEGQVAGIRRMIDTETYCVDVLHQFSAVQGALSKAAQGILSAHLHTCVLNTLDTEDQKEKEKKIEELIELFGKFGKVLSK